MKKRISIAVSVVALALLLIAGTVAVTVAYLTSKTDTVTNTFTVGKVAIDMDETDVDEYGVAIADADRVKANEYKLIPGHTYVKDPTIYVDATSEDCYLFVKIVNGLGNAETAIAGQLSANGWTLVDGQTDVYYHENVASANDEVLVFASFTIDGAATVDSLDGKTIEITGYAIQADGFANAAAAWAAAPAQWN